MIEVMNRIAKVIGRLLAVLIDKGIITTDEAMYILEPMKEEENNES